MYVNGQQLYSLGKRVRVRVGTVYTRIPVGKIYMYHTTSII
jgi:hypothetical protein